MVWPKSHTPFRKSELMLVLKKKCWTFCLQTWWRIIYKLDCKEFQIIWNGKNSDRIGWLYFHWWTSFFTSPRGQIRYISLLSSSLIIFELFSLKLLNYTHWSMIYPGMWMYFQPFPAWTKLLLSGFRVDKQTDRKTERQTSRQTEWQGKHSKQSRVDII